jgi:hypothetical protein
VLAMVFAVNQPRRAFPMPAAAQESGASMRKQVCILGFRA